MQIKKSFLAITTAAALGAGALGVGVSFAAENPEAHDPLGDLASAIATRFNLNADEVRSVIEEVHDERREERRTEFAEREADRLARLVEDGELTQEQADALKAKHEEMRTFHESLKDMTEEERGDATEAQREAMKEWAEEQDIDLKKVMPKPPRMHRGPGKDFGPGPGTEREQEATE